MKHNISPPQKKHTQNIHPSKGPSFLLDLRQAADRMSRLYVFIQILDFLST